MDANTTHTKTLPTGETIDVFKLLLILQGRKARTWDITKVKQPSASKKDGFSAKRQSNVDLDQPIIVDEQGYVIDGRHRLLKLIASGSTQVRVVIATTEDLADSAYTDAQDLVTYGELML